MKKLLFAAAASTLALVTIEFQVPSAPDLRGASPIRDFDSDRKVNELLHRACANCHSNETKIPWFGRSGPVAWIIRRDVHQGREKLNFSERASVSPNEREEIYDALADHSMPPKTYLLLHPESRISPQDLAVLEAWANR